MKSHRYVYCSQFLIACFSIFALVLYLTTISSEIDPYRYVDSTNAIYQKLNLDQAVLIQEKYEVWDWLKSLTTDIGGRTAEEINLLCQYPSPNKQTTTLLNGQNISIVDPNTPTYACPYDVSLWAKERMVSMSGNNQLLAFVMYFSRSNYYSNGKENGYTDARTSKHKSYGPNPTRDSYYLEILTTPWGQCVLSDGKFHTLGSTLQWRTETIHSQIVFEYLSSMYLNDTLLYPCYAYINSTDLSDQSGDYDVISGNPSYPDLEIIKEAEQVDSNKRTIWVIKSLEYYLRCLDVMSSSQPIMAYLTRAEYKQSYYELDYLSLCTSILNTPPQSLSNHYLYQSHFHTNKFSFKEFGTFFTCASELDWVISSHHQLTTEYLMDSLNEFTRSMKVYALTRNLGREDLFYGLTTITLNFDSNGRILVTSNINYSPIIQFTYGSSSTTSDSGGGYHAKATFLKTYILEVIFVIFFICFTLITLYIWFKKIYSVYVTLHAVTPITTSMQETMTHEDATSGKGFELVTRVSHSWRMARPSQIDIHHQRESETRVGEVIDLTQSGKENDEENPQLVDLGRGVGDCEKNQIQLPHEESFFRAVQHHPYYTTFLAIIFPFTYYDLLDLLTITAMTLSVIFRIQCIFKSLLIHDILVGLDIENGDYDSELENIVHLLLGLGSLELIYVNIIALTVSILLIQFFRYISFDERLAMISVTIYESLSLLIPVLLVFIVVLASYAMIGQAMYGKLLIEFSTLNHALNTLFLFVLGDTTAYYLSES
jgi:hypothetical protein